MSPLDRALRWFIAPPPADAPTSSRSSYAPPVPEPPVAAPEPASEAPVPPPGSYGSFAPPVAEAPDAPPEHADESVVVSAAVLGRAGDAEPVAAALALALRRESRARAATVAVVGPGPIVEAGGGAAAARRAASRLDAHGLTARVRGRLAWVRLDPSDPNLAGTARRIALIAAPAVLAVTAPRTPALDEALAEQDLLVVVTAEPGGPLAQLATSGLPPVRVVPVRPLPRGPRRALARAGVRAPGRLAREVRR